MTYVHRRFVYSLVCFVLITIVSAQADLECPSNITKNVIFGDGNAVIVTWPDMTQGGNITVTCVADEETVISGASFPVGVTDITCTNETSCTFTIIITECSACANGDNQNDTCACECDEHYQGLLCDECKLTPKNCTNGGQWNDTTCVCDCPNDFEGELCAECTHKNCNNGQLNKTTCKCDCPEGFEGELCAECKLSPSNCTNGGLLNLTTCECECAKDFEGELCTECTPKNCTNGQLDDTTCKCDCPEGFEGELCAECKLSPSNCTNGGLLNPTTCECDCAKDFEGELCTECTPKNCMNGQLDNTTCKCDCPEGFKGELCADCKDCLNDGGNQNSSTCACECTELGIHEGLLCGDCVSCQNNGLFQNQYTCECDCPGLWTGTLCKVCPQWLSCMNGGNENKDSCSCDCTKDWTGKDCSEAMPSVPADQYPEVDGYKTIEIEIALISNNSSTGLCNITANKTSEECQSLVDEFTTEVATLYQRLAGFNKVEVDLSNLREGSVITPHEVIYDYAKMSQEARQLSASALYEMTVGTAVSRGNIGELVVSSEGCLKPKDLTDICKAAISESCDKGFEKFEIRDGNSCYLICQPLCKSKNCGDGACIQEEQGIDVTTTCRCPQTSDIMYIGSNCQLQIELLWLYVGCGIGGGVLLLLIVVLIACVIRCNNENKKLKKGHHGKNTDNELRGEVLAVHNNGFVSDMATADDERGNTSSLTRTRPYSYIYGKEDGANGVSRSNSEVAQRNSRYESTVYREQPQDVDDLARPNQQQRSSYFWGNVSEPVKEDNELIPMVRGVDPSKMYKIQRPQISKHDDLPDRDYF